MGRRRLAGRGALPTGWSRNRHIPRCFLTLKRDAILATDRPFRRQAIKFLSQVALGRRRAHFHSWLPSLRIVGRSAAAPGQVVYRGRSVADLSHVTMLAGRHGSRIVIVGSGPSVQSADLGSLPERTALLLNGAISLIGGMIAEPLAVAIEDERFVWRHFGMMVERIPSSVPLLLSVGSIRAICDLDPDFLKARSVILIDDIRKPYGLPRRAAVELGALGFVTLRTEAGFSAKPDAGVFQGGSVVVSALQFSLAIQPAEVGFIGVDISNADAPRFYEDAGSAAFSGVADAERRILAHIALAREIAGAQGVRLVNHSAVSALAAIGMNYEPLCTNAS